MQRCEGHDDGARCLQVDAMLIAAHRRKVADPQGKAIQGLRLKQGSEGFFAACGRQLMHSSVLHCVVCGQRIRLWLFELRNLSGLGV